MNENLKPCPFCGGEAKAVAYYIKGVANRLNYFVQCENKCCRTRSRRKRANALADWENEIYDRKHERREKKMKEFNYLREKVRMTECMGRKNDVCDKYCDCNRCPLASMNNSFDLVCRAVEMLHPDEATEIVRKWAEEHPVKTRTDVLLEKFPKARIETYSVPAVCARDLGLTGGDGCSGICKDCWNTEVEE